MWNDAIAKLPRLSHETRRLSCGRIDGVEAAWFREDAILRRVTDVDPENNGRRRLAALPQYGGLLEVTTEPHGDGAAAS